jgi:hypothetical protein
MSLKRYSKALAAVSAAVVVAIPAFTAANQDGNVSLQEWLTVLGLFLPAVFVALSPANKLTTGDLVDQIEKNDSIGLKVTAIPTTSGRPTTL